MKVKDAMHKGSSIDGPHDVSATATVIAATVVALGHRFVVCR
jgi:hypothetical protein